MSLPLVSGTALDYHSTLKDSTSGVLVMSVSTRTLDVRPTGAALGAEILGVDLAQPLSAATVEGLQRAWDEHLVLLFREQQLDEAALLRLARQFGELDPPGPNPYGRVLLPAYPELNVVSNLLDEQGEPLGNLGDGELVWHADMTYQETPPKAAVLFAVEVPEDQGDTYFANMVSAFDALPKDLRDAIEDKTSVHDSAHNSAGMLRKGYEEIDDVTRTPGPHHPLVFRDAATGRRALFLGRRPRAYVPGLDVSASEALLDAVWAHATQPQFAWRHRWRPGDVLMWQNLWVLHRRDAFDPSVRRLLLRAQIKGNQRIS
jgi:taurine dioxygenase